jgi:hypothetical protein
MEGSSTDRPRHNSAPAGIVHHSPGGNTELGGNVKSGVRRWFYFPNATVTVDNKELVKDETLIH